MSSILNTEEEKVEHRQHYSSSSYKKLNSNQDEDSPFVTELERLLTESMNTESKEQQGDKNI